MTGRLALAAEAHVSWRALALAALLAALLAVALSQELPAGGGSSAPARAASSGAESQAGLWRLPPAARASISNALGADDGAYRAIPVAGGFRAANPAQHLNVSFERSRVLLTSRRLKLGLSLHAAGYAGSLRAVGATKPVAAANRVTYSRGAISEWYVNGPLGLEQGFTLARAPARSAAGALTLALSISSDAHISLTPGAHGITIRGADGDALRYGGLSASDARGRALRSWITLEGRELLLHLDTRWARFPVTVDPVVEEEPEIELSPEEAPHSRFGLSVALSSDGDVALVGAPSENGGGAAWVFMRSGSSWVQRGAKLSMPAADSEAGDCGERTAEEEEEGGGGEEGGEEADRCEFGMSVALSGDGSTAFVGAPRADENSGAVWVFTRSGSTWTQSSELTNPTEANSRFGRSVAVSADGSTALVGAPVGGRAWVFTRSGSIWSAAGRPLAGTGQAAEGYFGHSVALSADGEEALIGAPGSNGGQGAAWLFTSSGSSWIQPGSELTGTGETADGRFGSSVGLSGDGSTAIVGTREGEPGSGAAWVFANPGAGWVEQGPMLTGEGDPGEEFGASVALSLDGSTALVGAAGAEVGRGVAWLFERSGASWGSPQDRLEAGRAERNARFGSSVAVSANAETVLAGGRSDEKAGAAWVFGSGPAVKGITPEKGASAGGTEVTVTGENLTGATAVRFGSSEAASFSVRSRKTITAISPRGTGSVDVTVETPLGISATHSLDRFTYKDKMSEGGESRGGGHSGEGEGEGGGAPAGGTAPGGSSSGGISAPSTIGSPNAVALAFGPASVSACRVSLLSSRIAVQSQSRALLQLRGTGSGRCSGRLRLSVKVKAASKKSKAKTKTIGAAVFTITSGKTAAVRVKLNAAGRALLTAGRGRLHASLLIVKSSPAPTQARTASVRLARQKAHHSKA